MLMTTALYLSLALSPPTAHDIASSPPVIWLTQEDFRFGTYLIDQPGIYRLAEDISFNPNARSTLQTLCEENPAALPATFECPADAYQSGAPLSTQFITAPAAPFTPGGPADPRYHPAAFGLGFFAAIAISADNVTLDLNGHTLEQSEEHALLQRFFAVIELANQPFVPGQGPSDFGVSLDPARNVRIIQGTIGRSAHHGIHGNANERVLVDQVRFRDFEVAAVALNGVDDALIRHVRANNRRDVPVLGLFSAAQFIKPYLNYLVRLGVPIELNGQTADAVRQRLRTAINRVHGDLIVTRHTAQGRPQIDPLAHPDEFNLFANLSGVVDGNAYGFVINPLGVAVNGFPTVPDTPARNVTFDQVHIDGQHGAVTEVVTLGTSRNGVVVPVIDSIGAVFQTRNRGPEGQWLTIDEQGNYVGNVVADAQALVAKAIAAGLFEDAPLSTSRNSISPDIVAWVEGGALPQDDHAVRFLCNGDSMFHVNKGVIGFKVDGARDVKLRQTSIRDLANLGTTGSDDCGDYSQSLSHPAATLPGYGGAHVRGYTFAGSRDVWLDQSKIKGAQADAGDGIGIEILTNSQDVSIRRASMQGLHGGMALPTPLLPPNQVSNAYGIRVGGDTANIAVETLCTRDLTAPGDTRPLYDASGQAHIVQTCRE